MNKGLGRTYIEYGEPVSRDGPGRKEPCKQTQALRKSVGATIKFVYGSVLRNRKTSTVQMRSISCRGTKLTLVFSHRIRTRVLAPRKRSSGTKYRRDPFRAMTLCGKLCHRSYENSWGSGGKPSRRRHKVVFRALLRAQLFIC